METVPMKPRISIPRPLARARDRRIHKAIASLLLFSTTTTFAAPTGDYATAGRNQGSTDATQQAKNLGRRTGLEDGKNQGHRDGYDECARQMRDAQERAGSRQGDRDATVQASTDGSARGNADGQAKASVDGAADGNSRADQQANADATPKGTADGIAEANRSDAAARGSADGKVAGDSAAKSDAQTNEYQPARDQYKKERYAESIRSEATIDLNTPTSPTSAPKATSPSSSNSAFMSRGFNDLNSVASAALLQARGDALKFIQSSNLTVSTRGPGDPNIPDVKPTAAADQAIAYCKANASTVAIASVSAPALLAFFASPQIQPSGRPIPPRPGNGHDGRRPGPQPSHRPAPVPSTTPPTTPPPSGPQSEFEKCVDTFKPAYEQAFVSTFKTEYVNAYRVAFTQQYAPNKAQGCHEAKRADYRRDYQIAYKRSYDETYRLVFDRVYKNLYDKAYRAEFPIASDQAYRETYDGHYQAHYADAKAKAFADRQDQLYTGAFASAKAAIYSAKYPGYKAVVVKRARADEADDFTRVPVRLIGLSLKESVPDGIEEPGEKLTIDMDLRNFADTPIAARDLDIRAVAKTRGVALPGSVTILPKDLAAKSLNHVVGALDIRLDESALGKSAAVEIQISVRGNPVAAETINLTAKTLTTVELLETPVVHLGYPGAVKVRVTNNSSLALPENATLSVSTNMQGVVFSKTSEAVNGLGAGEARDIAFPFSADNYRAGQEVTFVGALNLASGRRIGILNESRQIPSLQDYAFKASNGVLLGDISDLRKKGKTRLKIYLKNVSSRRATETVTLTASITGPNAKNFSFTKGQQDQFKPIAPGEEVTTDKMVVKARKASSGGTFVVEVREGGKLLGVFNQAF
jgi:hypothetical protein